MKWEISFVLKGDSTYAQIVADAIRTRPGVEDVGICSYPDEEDTSATQQPPQSNE